jgi:hypothetical protein
MTKPETIEWTELQDPTDFTPRCKDFDEDCHDLDHLHCWLYDIKTGYCPYLRKTK